MKNPFDYFDKIYCINLDSRPDRWEQAKSEFEKVGILDRVERFSACVGNEIVNGSTGPRARHLGVDGDQIVDGELSKHNQTKWKQLDGITMSMLTCIKNAKENNFDNVLIFEDDVEFLNFDKALFSNTLKSLDKVDWEIFYLGTSFDIRQFKTEKQIKNSAELVSPNLMKLNARTFCIHATAIHKSCYDRLLFNDDIVVDWKTQTIIDHTSRVCTIDGLYAHRIEERYCSFPLVAVQRIGESDINCGLEINRKNRMVEQFEKIGKIKNGK
jgi:GR25 family glycosyltransferase involved in LPS biosynthesis